MYKDWKKGENVNLYLNTRRTIEEDGLSGETVSAKEGRRKRDVGRTAAEKDGAAAKYRCAST